MTTNDYILGGFMYALCLTVIASVLIGAVALVGHYTGWV